MFSGGYKFRVEDVPKWTLEITFFLYLLDAIKLEVARIRSRNL